MIIVTKAMKSKSEKQFQHGVRIGFLPATQLVSHFNTSVKDGASGKEKKKKDSAANAGDLRNAG